MKYIVAIIVFLLSETLTAQTYSSVISDDEIINFINLDIKRDSAYGVKTVRREMFKLYLDDFYFKDSADYDDKNYKNFRFIFQHHVYSGRVISFHLDTVFNRKDIDFFLKQINGIKNVNSWRKEFVNSKFFEDVKFDSNARVETNYSKRAKLSPPGPPESTIYTYSIPLFSADKTKAIIIKGFYCGMLCGGGGYYIYKKTDNNQWVLLTEVNGWAE